MSDAERVGPSKEAMDIARRFAVFYHSDSRGLHDADHALALAIDAHTARAVAEKEAENTSLRSQLRTHEERCESLKRKLGSRRIRGENVPDGYQEVEAWTNDKEVVVLGDPPDEDEHPNAHNCDQMGRGSFGPHVIARTALGIDPEKMTPEELDRIDAAVKENARE